MIIFNISEALLTSLLKKSIWSPQVLTNTIIYDLLLQTNNLGKITNETDISPFEMIHSGLIERLVAFLAVRDSPQPHLEARLNQSTVNYSSFTALRSPPNPSYVIDLNDLIQDEFRCLRPKQFLATFARLPFTFYCRAFNAPDQPVELSSLSSLLAKLHNCVNQLEQYSVRVNDVPLSAGGGECGSKNAIKFFNTHQLKCLLRRHGSCSSASGSVQLSQWKGWLIFFHSLKIVDQALSLEFWD
jgi:hypothetical protein